MTRPDPAFAALLDAALYDQDPARRDGARSRIARTARGAQVEGLAALLDAPSAPPAAAPPAS
ncbi:MAG: hypothetical protein H6705_06335 [Myxococcales bacterium]|nr:hypothetical protein [Myxococcales bacterium]